MRPDRPDRMEVVDEVRRVRFGPGSLDLLAEEVDRVGDGPVLVVSTPGQRGLAERAADLLPAGRATVLASAAMHAPPDSVEQGVREVDRVGAGIVVAVGGSSSTALAKAVALQRDTKIVAVPTTYAGSEMTPVWGLTQDGVKRTGRDERVRPVSVVYDPTLTLSLPVRTSVSSGFNAIAHAVEGSYAPDGTRLTDLHAQGGIRSLLSALPVVVDDPDDLEARSAALFGAWLCGATLADTRMGLHHALCHRLGGALDLPHAELHAVLIPYVLAYNLQAAPLAAEAVAQTLGGPADAAAEALQAAGWSWGTPRSLADLGVTAAALDRVGPDVAGGEYVNPRDVTPEDVQRILWAALAGDPADEAVTRSRL